MNKMSCHNVINLVKNALEKLECITLSIVLMHTGNTS